MAHLGAWFMLRFQPMELAYVSFPSLSAPNSALFAMEVHVEVNHRDRQLHITKAVPRKKSCETMTIWCETMTIWARADLRDSLLQIYNLLASYG